MDTGTRHRRTSVHRDRQGESSSAVESAAQPKAGGKPQTPAVLLYAGVATSVDLMASGGVTHLMAGPQLSQGITVFLASFAVIAGLAVLVSGQILRKISK